MKNNRTDIFIFQISTICHKISEIDVCLNREEISAGRHFAKLPIARGINLSDFFFFLYKRAKPLDVSPRFLPFPQIACEIRARVQRIEAGIKEDRH